MTTPMVQAIGVRKSYGANEVLKSVDLTVARGEVTCLIGPSGSGKSTLLRCINHLEKHDAGELRVDGELVGYQLRNGKLYERTERELCEDRAAIGMVFQRFNLFPHFTALENITIGQEKVKGVSPAAAKQRAHELLERVGLGAKADHYPSQLSGGQQQRVAIARALVKNPEVILADEPTGNLDEETRDQIIDLLVALNKDKGITVILVTHDSGVAAKASKRLHIAKGGVQTVGA